MTVARFDAPASSSPACHFARPPYASGEGIAFRLVRLIWLTARLARAEPVSIADYQRRFGVSLRSFHRDMAALRQAGFHIGAPCEGQYRLLCFFADADHA
jgi:hypothetical protein